MYKIQSIFQNNFSWVPTFRLEGWKLNPLTLAFSGEIRQYENEFREDYYSHSLKPMRFALVLAVFLFAIFAFLDALVIPELKYLFWTYL